MLSDTRRIDEFQIELSKSVSKVQALPNITVWNEFNAVLRDYLRCFFSKKTSILRRNRHMQSRKRVIIVTLEDVLLVYETNCTGYAFPIRSAVKINTSCSGAQEESAEKECVVTLKYKFGSVNLQLFQHQISIWRRSLWSIFDGEDFDNSLVSDVSLYTAKATDDEEDFPFDGEDLKTIHSNEFDYTDSVYSLKAVPACLDLSPDEIDLDELDVTQDAMVRTSKTNSNRSLQYMPQQMPSSRKWARIPSRASVGKSESQQSKIENSGFRRPNCVSYLAKRFEDKWKESIRKRFGKELESRKKADSPPLEVLFPPIPVERCKSKEIFSMTEENHDVMISTLQYTPKKVRDDPITSF